MITPSAQARLPTRFGTFILQSFDGFTDGFDHLALTYGEPHPAQPVLMRIHSECLTGEVFGSQRCDCQAQLQDAMQTIAQEGAGVILYLRQEGRGIGLKNKLRAYELQDEGMDTVQANEALGFAGDLRDFQPAIDMLQSLGVTRVRLMTNNPLKIKALEDAGITVVRVPLVSCVQVGAESYMQTKADKMGHLIPPEIFSKKSRA